jgi:multidrug resistance efflux pump
VLIVAFVIWRYGFDLRPPAQTTLVPAASHPGAILYSGTIHADEVRLSSEYNGRVAEVTIEEGDTVTAGQVLVRLDPALLDDQIAIAEAQVALAKANLRKLEAGARPGTLRIARAQEAQATAARNAAQQSLADAQALLHEPQELAVEATVAQHEITAAQARVQQAVALRDAAQMGTEALEYLRDLVANWRYPTQPPEIPETLEDAPYDFWQAWSNLNAATAALEGAKARLAQLEAQRIAPQDLMAQADAAAAALAQAEAGLAVARAQVQALSAPPRAEEVAAAQARVAQAQAALQALREQRQRLEIAAPQDGTVLVRHAEPGEGIAAGAPLITLANLQQVVLTLYVAEKDLGAVHLGQAVHVSVDSYPERIFTGHVVHIADEAEYTPRNVATEEERVNTLYAVKVRLPNPDGALKIGMPADATLEGGQP